ILAAEHGKHIFCEKPLATSLTDAQAMTEAAERAHVRTLVGFSNRWNPTFQHARQLIAAGVLGHIHHVHAQSFNASLLGDRPSFTWRTDPQHTGSGILGDLGAHAIDLIHYLLGPITAVCASLRTCQPLLYDRQTSLQHTAAVDDEVSLLIQLDKDIEGTITLSRLGAEYADFPIGHRQLLIGGSHGAIAYENGHARLYHPNHRWEELPSDRPAEGLDHATFLAQGTARILQTFLQAIEQQTDLPPTFHDGLRCQAVLDAAIRSSRRRAWENVVQPDRSI
ncbi:MAG: Gfo/Idh/MocA family oxidoreductase, partial [Chloroflexi bacterium]|nr:Gfo/Idh/MocA family oxidoreductase [Chloroflexota bacterium]